MLDEKTITDLRAAHGPIAYLHYPKTDFAAEADVVVKKPPRGEYKRFRAMLNDDAQLADARETLAKACVVYPALDVFAQLLDDQPALADSIGNRCAELAGAGREVTAKKL